MGEELWDFLSEIKVLDLTDERGFLCGKILADLGADVIKVEPPGGDPSRNKVPLYEDGKNLAWFCFNTNKRGITLNLQKTEGRKLFKKLCEKADIIMESFPPGTMREWNIDYDDLIEVKPSIIVTSITPFGRIGPYKDYRATDLTMLAMGGILYLTGDPDRPPVQIGYPQAYLHAGAEAAVATMMALYNCELTGQGQLIDVSIQQSLLTSTFQVPATWYLNQENLTRMGTERAIGPGLHMPVVWPCKDAFVSFTVLGGVPGRKTMGSLAKWMEEEGMKDEFISQDWGAFDFYGLTTELVARVVEPVTRFFMRYTKAELFEEFTKRGIMGFPITTVEDKMKDPHLVEKGFWQELEHLVRKILYPSPPPHVNGEYSPIRRRAPLIGEHNEEVYGALLSHSELIFLREEGVI